MIAPYPVRRLRAASTVAVVLVAMCSPAAQAYPVSPLPHTLARILHSAGGDDGALVAIDRPSQAPLTVFAHDADTPRILASNTKLFTTAAGLARYGSSIAGELRRILLPSDNRLAQNLSNRLGHGSPSRGARAAIDYARSLGAEAQLVDGSGLSRRDQAAPADIVRLLLGMEHTADFRFWVNALPRAGRSGTLRYRMRGTSAYDKCSAKTGTLTDVSALSGYCHARSGHRVIFSFLLNHVSTSRAQAAEDHMLAYIVRDG